MQKRLALILAAVMAVLVAAPAGAAPKLTSAYALKGEARALELAIMNEGVTLGFALAQADSAPSARGIGAGQCTLLGNTDDPDGLPCTAETTVESAYPGNPGSDDPACRGGLPAPLSDVVDLKLACGSSSSSFSGSTATTRSRGEVTSLHVKLPVGLRMVPVDLGTEDAQVIIEDLTGVLAPVLDVAPKEVRDTLEGTKNTAFETLDGLLEVIAGLDVTDAVKAEIGVSTSAISRSGKVLKSQSSAAGARIGLLGIPGVGEDGGIIQAADPLKNGLVIIEVGTAQASASVDRTTATAVSAASPALVTVKVRDITKPKPEYVEVSVAPGQTLTLLEGTPAETTIVAADSETSEEEGSARAKADAVSVHALKGVEGGVRLGLAGTTAAAEGEVREPEVLSKRPPRMLPQTGARDGSLIALALLVGSVAALVIRRRVNH